jgi:spore germination protein GerM
MTRPVAVFGACVLPVAIAVLCVACGGGDEGTPAIRPDTDEPPADSQATTAEEAAGDDAEPVEPATTPLRSIRVRLYFPAADDTVLVGEDREIFDTAAPGDRAKQILSDLLSGPERSGAVPAVARGVRLRQVYVMPEEIAYADFSRELTDLSEGGSANELMTVYAIVNSVALNVPEIRRLGILVDGEEIETLSGHLDLRRTLAPRTDLIREPQE